LSKIAELFGKTCGGVSLFIFVALYFLQACGADSESASAAQAGNPAFGGIAFLVEPLI
jgi:hypothetical protein